jgi:DNA-binding LacI/PurR family transcriptional regulator
MGAIAAEILINKIKNPQSNKRKEIILEPKIIIRKTTKMLET